jgi:hypothetical protein
MCEDDHLGRLCKLRGGRRRVDGGYLWARTSGEGATSPHRAVDEVRPRHENVGESCAYHLKQVRAGVVLRWGTTREGPVLRFFCISFSSLFSFLFLKPYRFSLCSPSFYVPLSLGHMHMHMHVCLVVVVVVVVVFTKFLARNIWPTGQYGL